MCEVGEDLHGGEQGGGSDGHKGGVAEGTRGSRSRTRGQEGMKSRRRERGKKVLIII